MGLMREQISISKGWLRKTLCIPFDEEKKSVASLSCYYLVYSFFLYV